MELSKAQLYVLSPLRKKGWPLDLVKYLVSRAGATQAEYEALIAREYIVVIDNEVRITGAGKKAYKTRAHGV